ncbi:MAG: aldo/keto reductase [Rhodoferax sp.]|nr:aldo/keto reductase [Rhodoferax sp.]
MKMSQLGSSGIACSSVGLGTWAMGGWMWGGSDDVGAISAIHASLDAGVNFIDTAPAYGLGHAEELVGHALKGRRDKVVLATKCGLVWHTQKGTHFFNEEGHDVYRYLGKDSIAYELEQSLARLKTDYVDLYFTHWQDETTPIEETMGALLDLKRQGKIRAIGISNANETILSKYLEYGPVDAIQERYSLLDRELEQDVIPLCRKHNVSVHGYSSLALGLLAGPIPPTRVFEGDDQRRDNPRFSPANRERLAAFFQAIEPIRAAHGCSFGQLMIAWSLSRIDLALCGARKPAQAQDNAGAGALELAAHDLERITTEAARHLTTIA